MNNCHMEKKISFQLPLEKEKDKNSNKSKWMNEEQTQKEHMYQRNSHKTN